MQKPESILVLECSSPEGSWAYQGTDGALLQGTLVQEDKKISQLLPPALKQADIDWNTLDRIVVGVGPGSFSGIRVAIATAQGIARATQARLSAIPSTHAIGRQFQQVSFLGVFSDARRQSVFFTAYEHGTISRPSAVFPKEELEALLSKCSLAVSTDGLSGVPETAYPQATALLEVFQQAPQEEMPLEPIYLHPPVLT